MPPFSFLLVEAARGQPVSVREEEEGGRLGRAGGLGRPGGRGPVGEGRENRPLHTTSSCPVHSQGDTYFDGIPNFVVIS
jgi:hypothetical protein